jgi:ankyrin repeat protein
VFEFLVDKLNLAVDETDFMGRNPFMINVAAYPSRQTFGNTVEKLLQKGIRFDLADSNNRTPFLIYYENHNSALANKLLDMGANINQMDQGGLFALKYALIRR